MDKVWYREMLAKEILTGEVTYEELISLDLDKVIFRHIYAQAIESALSLGKEKFMAKVKKHYSHTIKEDEVKECEPIPKPQRIIDLEFERRELQELVSGCKNHMKDTTYYSVDIREFQLYAEFELGIVKEELALRERLEEIGKKISLAVAAKDPMRVLELTKEKVELQQKPREETVESDVLYDDNCRYDRCERSTTPDGFNEFYEHYLYENWDDRMLDEMYPAPEIGNSMLWGIRDDPSFLAAFKRTFRSRSTQGESLEDVFEDYPVKSNDYNRFEPILQEG